MSKDNLLEVMNILDILKNEAAYRERLETIQKAAQELRDTEYIVATVKQAAEIKAEAERLKKEYEELLSELDHKVDSAIKSREEELLEAKKLVKAERLRLEQWAETLKKEAEQNALDKKINFDRKEVLHREHDEWEKFKQDLERRENLLKDKINLINEIFKKEEL